MDGSRGCVIVMMSLFLSLLQIIIPVQPGPNRPPPLTTAVVVRELTPEQARESRPIELTGVVTLTNPTAQEWFVQDDTSGIYVSGQSLPNRLKQGSRVRVTGVSAAGWFSPIVQAKSVDELGQSSLPAPLPYTFSQNDTRWSDAQYVQAFCIVRGVKEVNGDFRLVVEGTSGPGVLRFREPVSEPELRGWVGAVVRVRGVSGPEFDRDGKVTGSVRILVQSRHEITVIESAERIAASPIRTTQFLRQFLPGTSPIQLVRMTGVVTATLAADAFLAQDDTGGYTVQLRSGSSTAFPPGSRVEVAGFLTWNAGRLTVGSADVKEAGTTTLPPPLEIRKGSDLVASDGCRVRYSARVTEVQDDHFILSADGLSVTVRHPGEWGLLIELDAVVTATGALANHTDESSGLTLIPNTPADIVVTDAPTRPFLTRTQVGVALGVAGVVIAFGIAWVVALRSAVRTRTRQLAESEQKFATAFHASPDPIVITRAQDGVYLEVNDGFCRMIGCSREQVIGRSALEFSTSDAADRERMRVELAQNGRVQNYLTTVRTATGERREMVASLSPIVLGGTQCLLAVGHDVTERNQAERAVRASEAKFSTLFAASPQAIVISLFETSTLIDVNNAYVALTGWRRDELIGRPAVDFNLFPDLAKRQAIRAELLAQGFIRNRDATLRAKDGRLHDVLISIEWVEIDGQRYVLSAIQDITERRQMEQALASSEKKFAALFQMSPIALGLSTRDGRIVDVNQACADLFAVPRERIIGQPAVEVPGLYADPADRHVLIEQLTRDGRLRNVERTRPRVDGTPLTTVMAMESIELDGIPHVLTAVADITLQKQAQVVLHEANANLEQRVAERTDELQAANQELEAFCYSVSHDLRAPLRSIDGFSLAVLEDYEGVLDATGKQYLVRVRAAAKRMSELIDDLLTLSRVTRVGMRREQVSLSDLAVEVVAELRQADPHRSVEVSIAPNIIAVGDRALLRVALVNLIGNAWKYTARTDHPRIEFGCEEGPKGQVLTVRDNGAGFDPTYAHKLFQPFQRLHRPDEFPGHGVGLATVLRVIRRHGGTVSAEGSVGNGATFRVTIP